MQTFKANIEIIGINPFVFVPENVLTELFIQAGKDKGPIPISGLINGKPYKQTLVKYRGFWRLYINTIMLKSSPKRIGETIEISVAFDASSRKLIPHPKLINALQENSEAKTVFDALIPSRQHEIVRYIGSLKTEESVDRNVARAINFLTGKERFIGRDKPWTTDRKNPPENISNAMVSRPESQGGIT